MKGKLKWLLLMPILLTPPYVLTNRFHFFEAYEVPRLAFDDAIPFIPELSLVYLGLFPFMWWAVLQQRNSLDAKRFVWGGMISAWFVSLIFLFYPTTFSRPETDYQGIYSLVILSDTPYNACPSLHGTYAVYSGIWLAHAMKSNLSRIVAFLIVVLIFYATIAVRQHGIIDLALGGGVGGVNYFWARKLFPETVAIR